MDVYRSAYTSHVTLIIWYVYTKPRCARGTAARGLTRRWSGGPRVRPATLAHYPAPNFQVPMVD